MAKCKPREYYTVNGDKLTYGFRCKHFPSRRFKTEEAKDIELKAHKKETKNAAK